MTRNHILFTLWTIAVVFSFTGCNPPNKATEPVVGTIETQTTPNDSVLSAQLRQIAIEDQTLRLLLPDAMEKFGVDAPEYTYIWSLIHRQDTICLQKIKQIIYTHGWLGKSRVGDEANQAIWLVIQHADLTTQETFLPLLSASVTDGESEGWHLAFLEDRIRMTKGEPQIYGTQSLWDNDLKVNKIYPIQNVAEVNNRRAELGLEPVEEFAKMNGYIYDQNNTD